MRKLPILLGILALVGWFYWTRIGQNSGNGPGNGSENSAFLDRSRLPLVYTRHARCRMECRGISRAEVEEIFQNGKINLRKSDLRDRPCPTFAVEGITRIDRQRVRLIFAQCDQSTKVVTCIDLDREYVCTCN